MTREGLFRNDRDVCQDFFINCQSEALDNFPNLAASYSSLGADNI